MSIFRVTKGFGGKIVPERLSTDVGSSSVGTWTTIDLRPTIVGSPPVLNDPIDLILQLLTSGSGDGSNGSYDVFEPGIGLGIPADHIDVSSFTAIQQQYDWNGGSRAVAFHFWEQESAKDFIDQELCRPFGIYLRTGNDGVIRCIRPLHPQKFYVSDANNFLSLKYPTGGALVNAFVPIGVTTAQQMAANVAAGLNAVSLGASPFSCSYNTSTHKFTISSAASAFDLISTPALQMLGWTGDLTGSNSYIAPNPRGQFQGPTLTQGDMWNVSQIDNRDDQISCVQYKFDYDADTGAFKKTIPYSDVETTLLGDTMGDHQLTIESRGLIAVASTTSSSWVNSIGPGIACGATKIKPLPQYGVDHDTWAKLYALALLDRYKQPPLKFSARLKWTWNTLEVGDVVRVNYTVPGVFSDYELNAATLNNRLFEVVALDPNFDGSLDVTFLGFRYVNY